MANRTVSTEITKWQGINVLPNVNITENCTEQQVNFRINADGSISTREGCKLEVDFSVPTATDIGGYTRHLTDGAGVVNVWHGHIGSHEVVVVVGTTMYAVYTVGAGDALTYAAAYTHPVYEGTFGKYVELFEFDKKTYLVDGKKFYVFTDFTYTISAAQIYVPVIEITTPPAGGGEMYESINVLSAKRKILYSTVNGTSSYTLPESAKSIDGAVLDGVTLDVSTKISFVSGGSVFICTDAGTADSGINNFEIEYTCTDATYQSQLASLPMQLRPIKFAGTTDTQVFYYEGNTTWADFNPKNVVYYSDIGESGADPTYIAAENYVTVGDSSPITDAIRLYNRLLIFTESSTWYIGYTEVTLDEVTKQAYTVNALHDGIGCYIPHTALLLDNIAATATDKAFYLWQSTNVKDERNAAIASLPIEGATDVFGAPHKTLDDDYRKEAWFARTVSGASKTVLVYNYSVGAWYFFEIRTGADDTALRDMLMINKKPAFYTAAGLYVLNEAYDVDDKGVSNTPINATAKFRPFYFGRPEFHKNCYRYFITAKPKIPSQSIPNPAMTVFVSSDNTPYAASVTHVIALSNTTDMSRVDFAGETIRRRCHYRRFYSIQMSVNSNSPITLKKIRFDGEITDSLVGG